MRFDFVKDCVTRGELQAVERRVLPAFVIWHFSDGESGSYLDSFQFGPAKLTPALTPPDRKRYQTGNAVKDFLSGGVRFLQLDSVGMRQPSAATRPTELDLDGTNLPRVVGRRLRDGPGLNLRVARSVPVSAAMF